ncbi:hypothetical protein ABNG03_18160 [Halorubrum sp. RMP-47]|uniref:hypothetical protein n=1 Tax=Halorubrum miltondacostae TaxID=3076378 RepID=UPI0035275F60
MTKDAPSLPEEFDEHLVSLTATLESTRETIEADHTLATDQRMFAGRLLYLAAQPITEAKRLLPDVGHDTETQAGQTTDSCEDYGDAIAHIEQQLCWLINASQTGLPDASHYDEAPDSKFTTALEHATALRDILPAIASDSPVVDEWEHISLTDVDPHVGGRGDADGRWLEYQLQRALGRWGYNAATRQHLFSLEVDVVAKRKTYEHEPSDWIVAQCKDWTADPITPSKLFRLCTVAFACRAMPVLCHTTELTPRTEKLARELEVRVLELKDLECAELPAPRVAKPTMELREWRPQYRARDVRGSLPLMFWREPGRRFSYVPGFKPVGNNADYEPIESDRDDDSHPAAGH